MKLKIFALIGLTLPLLLAAGMGGGAMSIGSSGGGLAEADADALYLRLDGTGTMTGALPHSAGTAAAPSMSFDGDADTGWYSDTANQMKLGLAGAAELAVSAAAFYPAVDGGLDLGSASKSWLNLTLQDGGVCTGGSAGGVWWGDDTGVTGVTNSDLTFCRNGSVALDIQNAKSVFSGNIQVSADSSYTLGTSAAALSIGYFDAVRTVAGNDLAIMATGTDDVVVGVGGLTGTGLTIATDGSATNHALTVGDPGADQTFDTGWYLNGSDDLVLEVDGDPAVIWGGTATTMYNNTYPSASTTYELGLTNRRWSTAWAEQLVIGTDPNGATMTGIYSGTTTVDLASIAANTCSADISVTVTGAATTDGCFGTLPPASVAGLVMSCEVSAANTAIVQACNVTAGAIDPASLTYRAVVMAF